MSDLADVSTNDLITASRQNDINDYIEQGTHRTKTAWLTIIPQNGSIGIDNNSLFFDSADSYKLKRKDNSGNVVAIPFSHSQLSDMPDLTGTNSDHDARYIRLDGTPGPTTASIPFAEGLSIPAGKNLSIGGMTISESIIPGANEYLIDGASDHRLTINRHLYMGNAFSLGENFFYVGIPDGNSGRIWYDDSIGTLKIENQDVAATTGDIGLISTQKNIFVQLGDSTGTYKFIVKDSGQAEVASIDSDGKYSGIAATLSQNPSSTNSVIDMLTIQRTTTGTAGNGIGAGIKFNLEDASGNNEEVARIDVVNSTAAHASQVSEMRFKFLGAQKWVMNSAGDLYQQGGRIRMGIALGDCDFGYDDGEMYVRGTGLFQTNSGFKVGTSTGATNTYEWALGETMTVAGGLVIDGPGGSSCPYIYVLSDDADGATYFKWDNDILSEIVGIQNERWDNVILHRKPKEVNGVLTIRIKENDPVPEYSFINAVEFYSLRYNETYKAVLNQNGNSYAFRNPIAPTSAIADNGEDITAIISQRVEDSEGFDPLACTWYRDTPTTAFYSWYDKSLPQTAPLILTGGKVSVGNWKAQEIVLNFPYEKSQGNAYLIVNADKCSYSIWVKDENGVKQEVENVNLHERWTDTLIALPNSFNGEVFIKREIDNPKISFVALTTEVLRPIENKINELSITNQDGHDMSAVVTIENEFRYKMEKGDYIELKYPVASPPLANEKISYLVKCKGFYHAANQSIYGNRLNPIL